MRRRGERDDEEGQVTPFERRRRRFDLLHKLQIIRETKRQMDSVKSLETFFHEINFRQKKLLKIGCGWEMRCCRKRKRK